MNTDFNQNNLRILLAKILTYLFAAMGCDLTVTSHLIFQNTVDISQTNISETNVIALH